MTDIIPYDTLNPASPLVKRTEDWITMLYNRAVALVEHEHAEIGAEQAPWKLLTEEERDADAVERLDSEKRRWNIEYQNLVDEKALELADTSIEAIRAAIANIVAMRRRKMLRWQKLDNYAQVKRIAKQTLQIPPGSQGRQITSFIDNHLDIVEQAEVEPGQTLEVLAREDAFVISASRAISRTQKMAEAGEINEEERVERIQGIMELASSADKASEVRKTYINGNQMHIPRDIVRLQDGTTLVTFVCADEHEYSTLDRKTETISVQYGNAQPILAETQAERTKQQILKDIRILWAIVQSGEAIEVAKQYSDYTKEIIELFFDMQIMGEGV